MKPYQLKLRIFGVLSLIAAMLVAFIPIPSRAVNADEETKWQDEFTDGSNTYYEFVGDDPYYIDLKHFAATTPTEYKDQNTTFISESAIRIPEFAIKMGSVGTKYIPRIGYAFDEGVGVFQDSVTLRSIDLSNVLIDETATSLHDLFNGCKELEEIIFSESVDTQNVTDVSNMFAGCEAIRTIDLSNFDLSGVTDADGMISDCSELETIQTPKNVPDGITIDLPYSFANSADLSKVYNALPKKTEAGEDTSLKLIRAVTSIAVDPSASALEIGDSFYMQIKINPTVEGSRTVSVTSSDAAIASVDHEQVQVDTEGNAYIKVTGNAAGTATITATIDGVDTNGAYALLQDACEVTVTKQIVPVTDIEIASADDEDTINVNETLQINATITPTDATNKVVNWKISNETIARIDKIDSDGLQVLLTPTKGAVGTVVVTATTSDGEYQDTITVNVETPYVWKEVVDNRTDASNRSLSEGEVTGTPMLSDWYLHIDTDTSTAHQNAINQLLALASNYTFDKKSYFTLSKYGNGAVTSGEDFGTATITMALPGDMLAVAGYQSKLLQLYAYDGTSLNPIDVKHSSLGEKGGIGAARFTIEKTDDASLATAYVLAMDTTTVVTSNDYLFTVSDSSTKATPRATSGNPVKQTTDLYLIIKDTTSTVLKSLVEKDSELSAYDDQYYYDIYITDKANGNKPDSTIDFGSITVTLPVPSGITDAKKGKFAFVAENNGVLDKNVNYTLKEDTATGAQSVEFTATHFSEYAVLYDENGDTPTPTGTVTITTEHTGSGTTTVNDGQASANVTSGSSVTVKAVAADNYHFSHWLERNSSNQWVPVMDGSSPAGASYTFDATTSRTLTAVFAPGNASEGGTNGINVIINNYIGDNSSTSGSTSSGGGTSSTGGTTGGTNNSDNSNTNTTGSTGATSGATDGGTGGSNTGASTSGDTSSTSGYLISVYPSGNSSDMPTTGAGHMYRTLAIILLLLSGTVEILLSVPGKRRSAASANM